MLLIHSHVCKCECLSKDTEFVTWFPRWVLDWEWKWECNWDDDFVELINFRLQFTAQICDENVNENKTCTGDTHVAWGMLLICLSLMRHKGILNLYLECDETNGRKWIAARQHQHQLHDASRILRPMLLTGLCLGLGSFVGQTVDSLDL